MVPSYFGWIAAQFVALAGMLDLMFDVGMTLGILLVAAVAVGYTLLGGMWSVTLTDGFQITLVFTGLLFLAATTLSTLGDGSVVLGLARLWADTPPEIRRPVPHGSQALVEWLAVFAVGALGNIPGQDLMQRVFSARSAAVAAKACLVGGALYVTFGSIPVMLGLAARLQFPDDLSRAVLPALAHAFFEPLPATVFAVVLVSAVLSTIDSAILSPASVLAQNVLVHVNRGFMSPLVLMRVAVLVVAGCSLGLAFAGESAYALLEDAYELPLVGMLVPLVMGLYREPRTPLSAVFSILVGLCLWLVHYFAGWTYFFEPWTESLAVPPPAAITMAACSFIVYIGVDAVSGRSRH
jgi:Na+/proline symporter